MRHAVVHGMGHHHSLHELAVHAGKVLHQPGFWVAAGFVVTIALLVALVLMYGTPSQPQGWDAYQWMMPY